MYQRTLGSNISCCGVGLHSGQRVHLEILPAPENHGVTFVRTDLPRHAELRASVGNVADTSRATNLAAGVNGSRVTVGTVEHLLAAFMGLEVDNAVVRLDGPEIPALDGSSGPFVNLLRAAGIRRQRQRKRRVVITKPVTVSDGDRQATIGPGRGLRIECAVDFDHPLVPPAPFGFTLSPRSFAREVAWARTFGFARELEMLRAAGLARGGSLDNAVVIDEQRVLNPRGLRYPDELVRHKVLDALGDLYLFGAAVEGRLDLIQPGHALNARLVGEVLRRPDTYEIREVQRPASRLSVRG